MQRVHLECDDPTDTIQVLEAIRKKCPTRPGDWSYPITMESYWRDALTVAIKALTTWTPPLATKITKIMAAASRKKPRKTRKKAKRKTAKKAKRKTAKRKK